MSSLKRKKILVPLDGTKNSDRGLKHAIELAKQTKMSIIGMHVMPTYLLSTFRQTGYLKNEMQKKAKLIMKKTRQLVEQKNIVFEERIESGVPGSNIVTFARNKKNNVSQIIIGGSSKEGSKEKYFGSVSNYVLHMSKIPVTIV